MTIWTVQASGWLLQAVAAIPDPIVRQASAVEPGWIARVTAVATALMAILQLLVFAALLVALWRMREVFARVDALVDRLGNKVDPAGQHLASIADNVDYVTTAVRGDVERLSATLVTVDEKVRDALAAAERRAQELDALVQMAQDEAEHAIVSAVGAIQGAKAGAAALKDDLAAALKGRLGNLGLDRDGRENAVADDEEDDYGDDDQLERELAEARPRIRPRRRQRGRAREL